MLNKGATITVCNGGSSTTYKVLDALPDKKKSSRLYKLEATELGSNKPPYVTTAWIPNVIARSGVNEVCSSTGI